MASFRYFSHGSSCPVCGNGKGDCRESNLNGLIYCHDNVGGYTNAPGYRHIKIVGGTSGTEWGLWRPDDTASHYNCYNDDDSPAPAPKPRPPEPAIPARGGYFNVIGREARPLTTEETRAFAKSLGLPMSIARHWQAGEFFGGDVAGKHGYYFRKPTQAYVIDEWNFDDKANLRPVGRHFREPDGTKKTFGDHKAPHKRGLTLLGDDWAKAWPNSPPRSAVYIVEGATDTCALDAMGLPVIGRPGNRAGADIIAGVLKLCEWSADREIIVVGENDHKPERGLWPGRDGARHVARELVRRLGRTVKVAMPPDGFKDSRQWFAKRWPEKFFGNPTGSLANAYQWEFGQCLEVYSPERVAQEDAEKTVSPVVAALLAAAVTMPSGQLEAEIAEAAEAAQEKAAAELACPTIAEAARRIAAERRDQDSFRCRNCTQLLLRHRQTEAPYLIDRRCEKWGARCGGCRRWLVRRELTSAATHFNAAAIALYEFGCDPEQWEMMQRRIRRMGGQYLRAVDGAGWWVVCNVPVEGSIPVTVAQAVSTLETLIDCLYHESRPVSTSRGWALVREDSSGEFSAVGVVAVPLTRGEVAEIVAQHGAVAVTVNTDRGGPIDRIIRIDRPGGWRDCDEDFFAVTHAIMCGNDPARRNAEGLTLPEFNRQHTFVLPPPSDLWEAIGPDVEVPF